MRIPAVLRWRWASLAAATLILGVGPAQTHAAPVEFVFLGEITTHNAGGGVPCDQPITGSIRYDPDTPDSDPGAQVGTYSGAILSFDINLGPSYSLHQSGPGAIQIDQDHAGADRIVFTANMTDTPPQLLSCGLLGCSATGQATATIALADPAMLVFSDDSLPTILDLSDFPVATGVFGSAALNEFVEFNVTSLALVPEPSAAQLIIVVAAAIGLTNFIGQRWTMGRQRHRTGRLRKSIE